MRAFGISVTAVLVGCAVYFVAILAFATFGIRLNITLPEWISVALICAGMNSVHSIFDE